MKKLNVVLMLVSLLLLFISCEQPNTSTPTVTVEGTNPPPTVEEEDKEEIKDTIFITSATGRLTDSTPTTLYVDDTVVVEWELVYTDNSSIKVNQSYTLSNQSSLSYTRDNMLDYSDTFTSDSVDVLFITNTVVTSGEGVLNKNTLMVDVTFTKTTTYNNSSNNSENIVVSKKGFTDTITENVIFENPYNVGDNKVITYERYKLQLNPNDTYLYDLSWGYPCVYFFNEDVFCYYLQLGWFNADTISTIYEKENLGYDIDNSRYHYKFLRVNDGYRHNCFIDVTFNESTKVITLNRKFNLTEYLIQENSISTLPIVSSDVLNLANSPV